MTRYRKIHVLRIKPDQEIIKELISYCQKNKISSGVIISLLGSLKEVNLGILKSLPGKFIPKKIKGPLEIACGTGTIALIGNKITPHIHLVVSDENRAVGGHLARGVVFSTAEIVLGELEEQLKRERDKFTGLLELVC